MPLKSGSSSFRSSTQAALLEALRLIAIGACAVALHAAGRHRVEWGPGHQGLTWIALLMVARLTSNQRWAGITTAAGAAAATQLPIWHLGDPLLWAAYLLAGAIVDAGVGAWQPAVWVVALLGGLAHASKPLMRVGLVAVGWRYESMRGGLPFPLLTHFLFGVGGALIGAGVLGAARRLSHRRADDASG